MKYLYGGYSGYYFSFSGTVFIVPTKNVDKINSLSGSDIVGSYMTINNTLSAVYANSTYGKMMIEAVKELFSI